MKNIIIIIFSLTTLSVSGQNHFIGIKGGTSFSNVRANVFVKDSRFRTAATFGLTYDYLFSSRFSVGADLVYLQLGFKDDLTFTDSVGIPTGQRADLKYNYSYVGLPLKAGFNYGTTFFGRAEIGLVPAVLTAAKFILPGIDYNGSLVPGETYDIAEQVKEFDLGGMIALTGGYKINGRFSVYSTVSFQHSIASFTKDNYFPYSEVRHYVLSLNAGLKYALSKS